ncbi:MAG TPA: long-chain fatty acid--CoA ligase [Candidatus Aminicenantes bacterium]|nr:MAG: long-chain fatty acid--CoA ligase [Candidatus Aminicenantes bacterium]HEK86405.1 long-chain fatty acid--CoA ligase [Candidatus Aminicenantes bacterium]
MAERTLPQLFEESVKKFPDNVVIWEKRSGQYEGISYKEMQSRVHRFAAGLLSLGLKRGERVALISEGRADWLMSELGILYAGAVNVPISVKIDEPTELKFRLAHSGSRMAIVSGGQWSKIRAIKGDLPDLERIIILDKVEGLEPDEIYAEEVLHQGDLFLTAHFREFEETWTSVKESDLANICYTSGTTADPKGIMLTHRNYTSNVEHSLSLVECPPYYVTLLILPWDHAFAHTCGIYGMIKGGAAIACVESGKSALETIKNIPKNIREIRPTVILSVPSLAKSFKKNIEKAISEKGPKIEALFKKGLEAAYEYNGEGWNRGQGKRKLKKQLYFLIDKLIFSQIRKNFGGRLELFVGGGALLDIELQRFFYALGMPMFQGYGLTEASPVISANNQKEHKLGSSGKPARAIEVKICDENGNEMPIGQKGEIVIRGENVMAGYWKNEKASQEAIRQGWLYTGDLGYFDQDGYLYVVGRTKSLMIANDGEKYSPEEIEEAITEASPYIEQIMLYNNQSPYTVALVVPNKENLRLWLKSRKLDPRTPEGQEAALKLLESEIAHFREGGKEAGKFPVRWLPATFAVLGEGFTEQNRLMNSTLKIVRPKIVEFYKNRIEFMFTSEGKDILNHQNRTIISRL